MFFGNEYYQGSKLNMMVNTQVCARCKIQMSIIDEEFVCTKCGMVSQERLVNDSVDETFSSDNQNSGRVGLGEKKHFGIKNLGSTFTEFHNDSTGKKIDPSQRFKNLQRMQGRLQSNSKQKSLQNAVRTIEKLSNNSVLNFNLEVQSKAIDYYKKSQILGLTRGHSISEIAAASLYLACREFDVTRTIQDFAKHSKVKRNDLNAAIRLILDKLNIKPQPNEPKDYVRMVLSSLGLSGINSTKIEIKAKKLLEEYVKGIDSAGKDPIGLAASAIYLVSKRIQLNITQTKIANAAKISQATIRNRSRDLQKIYEKS